MYIFMWIVLIILLSVHYFVYYFFITIFSITKYKYYILVLFLILALSFVKATVLVHNYDNLFVRIYYLLVSTWLWILSNLFFAFIILAFLILVFKLFHINLNIKIVWIILIIISLFISWYSIYNAKNPRVKEVEVHIKNLPKSWKSKKVVFFSDLHLWAIIRENYLEKVVNLINSQNPDLVLISWDLFDWTDWNLGHLSDNINKINTKDGIYYVNWNHEVYLWMWNVVKMLKKTNIKILNNEIVNIDWVQLIWLSYWDERFSEKYNLKDIFHSFSDYKKNSPSLLLYHTPTNIEEFKNYWIDLQLSWHTHKWQIWPFWIVTNLVYKWYDYWLVTEWDYNIYTTNWVGTWWPPMRIWNTPEIVVLKLK